MREIARVYLSRLKTINEAINAKIDEKDDLMLMCTNTGSFDYSAERVQSSPPLEARFTITMEKYMELEAQIDEKIDEYVTLKDKIINEIHSLPDALHVKILTLVFVKMKSFDEIQELKSWKLKTSKTYEVYNEALDSFATLVLGVQKK